MSKTRKRYYKGFEVNSFGFPNLHLTKEPIKSNYIKRIYLDTFLSDFNKNSPKNLIVMYDIPSKKKKERDWFRRHLKKFNYVMIQKSVWVGPAPLPKDFLDYVKSIGLENKLKTLKLEKTYTGEGNTI